MAKPNYELVNGEPKCRLEACFYYRNYYSEQNPLYKPGKIHRCQASSFESVTKHILCIPGLREQRDETKKEKERLELELNKWETETAHEGPNTHSHPITPEFAGKQLRRLRALEKENERLKEELVRLKPSEVCTNCNGVGSLSQYDFYNGVHVEECPVCNGRREERESNLEKQGFEKHKHDIYTGQAIGGTDD